MERLGIIGGGAWGTALAILLQAKGSDVVLWAREPEVVDAVKTDHGNPQFLPGIELDPAIRATGELAEAGRTEAVLLAAPAQHMRATVTALAPHLSPGTPAVICAKGIEKTTCALMSEVVGGALPEAPLAVLSGPTFAAEVAHGLPTAVTLACADETLGARLVRALGSRTFRPYLSDDLVGAQIGGAVKNVLAIACGIVAGRQLGDNATAALTTRGLAEMLRLGHALGARGETLMGLSGLGDLVLTCNSTQSRNLSLGLALAEGIEPGAYLARQKSVAEGASTVSAVTALAHRHGIEMPISEAVDAVINHGAQIDAMIEVLLSRPFKAERADHELEAR